MKEPAWRKVAGSTLLGAMVAFPYALILSPVLTLRAVRFKRSDSWWAVAAVLLITSSVATGSVHSEFTFVVAFFAFKGGEALAARCGSTRARVSVAVAFIGAFVFLFGYALLEASFGGAQRVAGPSWFEHPNLFGPAVLIVGLMAANLSVPRWRWLSVAGILVVLLLTGSRSSLVAYFVTLVIIGLLERSWRRPALLMFGLSAVAVLLVSTLFPAKTWSQRILSPVYAVLGVERSAKNLMVWTEDLGNRTHWNAIGVDINRSSAPGRQPAEWTVSRVEPVAWARPQQAVEIARGEPFTLSAELAVESGTRPGFIGWSARDGEVISFEVALNEGRGEVLRATGLNEAFARVVPVGDGWSRLEFRFVLAGTGDATVGIGVSPSLESEAVGDAVVVRTFQLESGGDATTYAAAIHRTTGVGEALARGAIFGVAWQGIIEAPLFGHGARSFSEFYTDRGALGTPPDHAHNAFLQATFGSGALGLISLVVVLWALFTAGGLLQKALLAGLLVSNLFDSTFTAGVVFYLLAFATPILGAADSQPGLCSDSV